ncbi:MAG TPA: glycosyltransferase family 1 protein [Halothiobacillus sp.]|jgi:glycosyltransferase involved in cell wall biosynthesis|nr:glycosyltransferase family 1 protein [Halothiobacillus sp.]
MWLEKITPYYLFQRGLASAHAIFDARCIAKTRRKLQNIKKNNNNDKAFINTAQKQLLVDVSIICQNDAQTGIQRVVRALVSQLLGNQAPDGYIVRTVAASRKSPYRIIDWPGQQATVTAARKISIRPGDIFLGLDLCTRIVPAQQKQLAQWQRSGASLNFMVYDLLPLQHPQWFTEKTVAYFQRWLRSLAVLADQIICISPQVARDFNDYTIDRYRFPDHWIPIQTIPMGHDIASSQPSFGLPQDFEQTLEKIRQPNTILMVGTLEPRKGHEQVLSAFDHLWQSDKDYRLVIVGRPGWKTEALQERLKTHAELDQRLFWLDDASDEALDLIYHACAGVLIASWAEGFGLPLIEALGYGRPVLARDLPVFHEQQNPNITFFKTEKPIHLAHVVQDWITKISEQNRMPPSVDSTSQKAWTDSSKALWEALRKHTDKTSVPMPNTHELQVAS